MKCYKIKVHVNNGLKQQNFSSYMYADSKEAVRKAVLEYWNSQHNMHAKITEIKEMTKEMMRMWSITCEAFNPYDALMASVTRETNEQSISKAQALINDFLNGSNNVVYAINPDGSLMELQEGCTLLSAESLQMKAYVKE